MEKQYKFFSGSSGRSFASRLCAFLDVPLSKSEIITFTEGNIFVKINENARGKEIFLMQSIGLNPNNEFVEILFWADAFKRTGAKSVTVIMPYFSYAKADKKDEPRVSIRARVCADCLEASGVDRIITMDLHSPQVQGFFKKPVDNLTALPILWECIKRQKIGEVVIASPDAGYVKQARNFANHLNAPLVIGNKVRKTHDEKAEIHEVIGDVQDMNVIIVDDFTISGNTVVNFSRALKRMGARHIYLCLSHILLNREGLANIEKSPIELVVSTDSVYNPVTEQSKKIKIVSVAPLFGEAITRMIHGESISELFEHVPSRVLECTF